MHEAEHHEPARAGEPDRAVEAGFPPDSGPEQPVIKLHAAMFRARPMVFIGLITLVLAGIFGLIWFRWVKTEPWVWASWSSLGGSGITLAALGVWKIRCMMRRLEITNKRTVRQIGLFSLDSSEVLHDNIRNFTVRQSLWQRIWGVGTIGIASSGEEGVEIEMDGVPQPRKVQKIIDLYRPLG